MSERVISYADLSIINSALASISSDMNRVHSGLGTLNFKQNQLESQLVKLTNTFAGFVEADLRHKSLQLAETRQGNLKQELQIRFGYYAEVRRMATGILQAVDTGVVSEDTLRFATEEVMIKAQGYWLASALVALAAWFRDDKSTNEKALSEALKRDDYKTTLFFMLVMRRFARNEASIKWLERYFMQQNWHSLDREFVIILEAVTLGVFPPASRQLMMSNVKNWLEQLTQGDSYTNEQKSQWIKFFEAIGPLPDGTYPLLEKFSTNWDTLATSLKGAKTHDVLNTHFRSIFSSSADFSKNVKVQLDEILSLLVANFDDEELPLQEQVRLNQLIIQMDGNKAAAQAAMNTEKHIFNEQVNFLQLLTNASFNPEGSGTTKATQALALSISQPWVLQAYDEFTAQSRGKVPQTVELSIANFKASTKDGGNETELLEEQELFYQNVLKAELAKISFPYGPVVVIALVCFIGFLAFGPHIGTFGLIVGGILIWGRLNVRKKAKSKTRENVEEGKQKGKEVLRGCLAEIVDYRKEHATEDAKAEPLRQLLTSITPEDFSSLSKETARNII